MTRLDLLRLPGLKAALTSRWPQFVLRVVLLAGFLLAILSGLLGTPVGNRNFSIVAVWIAWWALLILVAVPLFGRAWCSVCPIPMPGEWLQNGALLGPGRRAGYGLNRRWPRRMRNIWLQNVAFTGLALFSTIILTQPGVTAVVLALLLLLAVAVSLIYERRAFCRYICPVGGFIGLYAQAAPIELRVKDTAVCAAHTEKACYVGNEDGYGCPWGVFPAGMVRNNVCGLCFECLRTCEYDNLALNLRPFGDDLTRSRGRKLDEAFKSFILLGSALVYAAVFLGPWGALKDAAYQVGSRAWLGYATALIALTWIVLPGVFALLVWLGHPRQRLRQAFTAQTYALVPLGLMAWIAFSLSFVAANISYLWPVLSDPFGWGWNLFGTANAAWTPYLTGIVPAGQIIALTVGVGWSVHTAARIAREQGMPRVLAPVTSFILLSAGGMLWLLVG